MLVFGVVALVGLFIALIAGLFFLGGKRPSTVEADSYTDEQRTGLLNGTRNAPSHKEVPRTSTGND